MLDLTQEERRVILFLVSVALIGLSINFLLKLNSPLKTIFIETANIARIEINKASLEDLVHTQCVSEKIARKIIEYRASHGPFNNIEELKEIKGIGEYRFQKLKDLFYVE